jgi:hypothetical protein
MALGAISLIRSAFLCEKGRWLWFGQVPVIVVARKHIHEQLLVPRALLTSSCSRSQTLTGQTGNHAAFPCLIPSCYRMSYIMEEKTLQDLQQAFLAYNG